MKIGDVNKLTPTTLHTQFLGVNMSWRTTERLISKLSTACCVVRSMNPHVSQTTLIMNYGVMFWGNSSYSCKIFRMKSG
jgi:hypothetical protein